MTEPVQLREKTSALSKLIARARLQFTESKAVFGLVNPMADISKTRPSIDPSMTAAEFEKWYWPVEQLRGFCSRLEVSKSGSKAELRERVAFRLKNPGQKPSRTPRRKKGASFDWTQEPLTKDTLVTDTVSFGPHVRGFFNKQIGKSFVCHSDFMTWMRGNPGATLGDAIEAWMLMEERKNDPAFRREIASCNNYLQYLRDARDRHPELSIDDARMCWDYKKVRPASQGMVIFEDQDLLGAGVRSEISS